MRTVLALASLSVCSVAWVPTKYAPLVPLPAVKVLANQLSVRRLATLALVKRRVANVGDQPAVTKSEQRIDISPRLTIYDTPGLLWPKIDYASDGLMLAASHAVGTNAVIEEEVATFLADLLLQRYPDALAQRYKLNIEGMDCVGVVEAIAVKRACRKKGGELDLEKASLVLLTDYRSGALGRISLETPATRVAMIEAAAAAAAEQDPDRAEADADDAG